MSAVTTGLTAGEAVRALIERRDAHVADSPEWSRLNDEANAALDALSRPLPRPRSVRGLEGLIRQELDWSPAAEIDALLTACRAGDTDAAGELMAWATNRLRGHVVAWAYKAGLPRPVLRALLLDAWDHDHQWVCGQPAATPRPSAGSRSQPSSCRRACPTR